MTTEAARGSGAGGREPGMIVASRALAIRDHGERTRRRSSSQARRATSARRSWNSPSAEGSGGGSSPIAPRRQRPCGGRARRSWRGDFARPDTLDAAFAGVDRVFLLAAAGPQLAEQQGDTIGAARRAGVRGLVNSSALGVAPDVPVSLPRPHADAGNNAAQVTDVVRRVGKIMPHTFDRWMAENAAAFNQD